MRPYIKATYTCSNCGETTDNPKRDSWRFVWTSKGEALPLSPQSSPRWALCRPCINIIAHAIEGVAE